MTDDAFREAMEGVERLDSQRQPDAPPGEPTPGQRRRRDAAVAQELEPDPNYLYTGEVRSMDPYERFEWKKDGVQPAVFQKLKSGGYPLEGRLDLHRRTVEEARDAVYRFLAVCRGRGWRCVAILHGRGVRSPQPGSARGLPLARENPTPARIKSYVAHWMQQAPEVIACSSAPPRQGGTGAVFVLLRKSATRREENRERHGLKSDPWGEG